MKLIIDTELLQQHGYTPNEVVYLLSLEYPFCHEDSEKFIKNGLIHSGLNKFELTPVGRNILNTLLFYKPKSIKRDVSTLVTELQNLFPRGRKGDTSYYWRGTKGEISVKLNQFFNKNPKITDEQVIEATKSYISSFKGEYKYMQLLKYFIEKDGISSLLSSIENFEDREVFDNENWTSQVK